VVVNRNDDLRIVGATVWDQGYEGFAGRRVAEGGIMKSVEYLGEEFANKYLATQAKDNVGGN
jgi:hypothetical protein